MATWINREAWWAIDRRRVEHVVKVLAHDLDATTMTVLLDSGARHEAPAYDIYLTKDAAELAISFDADKRRGYR